MLRIYFCKDFTGKRPIPTAGVIVAESKEEAADLLNEQISSWTKDKVTPSSIVEVKRKTKKVIILSDGDY